ncbi:RTA1 like protein [Hirsutella rhossiliensis]|uniref:RTA1 like protein n=1 Tax=Hirsutella rhossiliensis TaxID=111463 RepID=A0A9P8SIE1_9HYPO|nr:RTA1 like protein [Hirsutella rhossiliensis]KAH0963796.1 RTA1 like protein [Hirsutella rhossiliensis]
MRQPWILAALLTGGLVVSSPVETAAPRQTSLIAGLEPTPTLELRAAAPDVSIPPVSIPPVSIPPVSIPPLSLDLPTATCTPTIAPGKDGYLPPGSCGALWNYFPSFAAAVAFAVLFGVLLVAHLGQALQYSTGFAWVIIMASLWECGSYAFRAAGSKDQQSNAMATMAQLLVLLSPLWVNAFAYMVFARVVNFFSPTKKVWVLSPSILAIVFVSLDIVSFVIQLIGGGMAGPGSSPESQKKGIDIYMGGIGMQEGFIVLFVGLIVKFHVDQIRAERNGMVPRDKSAWRPLIYALYGCLLSISVRIIFRLIEFSGGAGYDNPLPNTESYFYALDGAPMWLAIFVWNAIHPGRYMQGPDAKMPPSWLSRHLCCCCHRKSKDGMGPHQRLREPLEGDSSELRALRSTDASLSAKEWSGETGTIYEGQVPRVGHSQLLTPYESSRDVSPEPTSHAVRRPRNFVGS